MTIKITTSEAVQALGMVQGVTRQALKRRIIRALNGAPEESSGGYPLEYAQLMKPLAIDSYLLFSGGKPSETETQTLGGLMASADCETESGLPVFVHTPYGMRTNDPLKIKRLGQRPDWYTRIQLSLLALNRTEGVYYQWWPQDSFSEKVELDLDYLEPILPRIDEFLAELKSEDHKPHLEPLRVIIDTTEAQMLIDEYDQLKLAVDNASERQKEILAELQQMANGESAVICGRNLSKIHRAGAVDYKRLVADYAKDVDLEVYRKGGSEFWQFR